MKNKSTIEKCFLSFKHFTLDNNEVNLIANLKYIESTLIKTKKAKSIWFKFFEGDTQATDIKDISNHLKYNHLPNFKTLCDCINIAVKNHSLQVYLIK